MVKLFDAKTENTKYLVNVRKDDFLSRPITRTLYFG